MLLLVDANSDEVMMKVRALGILMCVVCVGLWMGCDRKSERDDPEETVEQSAERDQAAEPDEPQHDGISLDEPARSTNIFAHKLWGRAGEGNAAFSPVSISTAMAMVYAGAGGQTAEQLASVLALSEDTPAGFGQLSSALDGRDQEFEAGALDEGAVEDIELVVDLVNDVWLQQEFEVGDAYLDTLDEHFEAQPTMLDFRASPDAARQAINEYVSEKTRAKIPELIPEGIITGDTRTVLTNAVYFKAAWLAPFQEENTKEAAFETPDEKIDVPMMHQTGYFRMADAEGFRALEMAYTGGELAALVVLPDEGQMEAVQQALDADTFADSIDRLEREYVRLALPKFQVRQQLMLAEVLANMGASEAFSPQANFDAIHPDLFLSEVVHEAYIDVDEKGTEAAAATAATMAITSLPPEAIDFVVDRPFLFYIYDKPSGAILFAARVVNPTGEK